MLIKEMQTLIQAKRPPKGRPQTGAQRDIRPFWAARRVARKFGAARSGGELRRRNSLPPSILNQRVEAASGRRNPKRKTAARLSFFLEHRNTIDANWAKGEDSAVTNLYLDLQPIPTRCFRLAQPKDPKGV